MHYYNNKEAVIFVVDAADPARFPEARAVLRQLLQQPAMSRLPLLVLSTKSDLPNALTSEEVKEKLGLDLLLHGEWYCQSVSALRESKASLYKIPEGIKWLHRAASKRAALLGQEEMEPWGFVPELGTHLDLRISYPGGDDGTVRAEEEPGLGGMIGMEVAGPTRDCGIQMSRMCLPV